MLWQGTGTSECGMAGATWTPIVDTCWYPIDLLASEGPLILWRRRSGVKEETTLRVGPYPYPVQQLQIAPAMVNPPPDELARIQSEQRRIAGLWRSELPRRFTLPLAPPLAPLPQAVGFGSRRVLNGEARSPHSGVDLAAAPGTPVRAVARGTVVLAGALYFSGNSVFIDHGDQLVSMYFHLADIAAEEGGEVSRGDVVGSVGATGRATGPHLHFAVRWHGARVDPSLLLEEPSALPEIRPLAPG